MQADKNEPIKPDLKHDNMEFTEVPEEQDALHETSENILKLEEEEITAAELDLLFEEDEDEQAAALITAENDSKADADNFLEEAEPMDELNEMDQADEADEDEYERN